jgi:CRISPR-associated protein Cmr3
MTGTNQVELTITPVNTVIARDGRPIQTGRRMKSLPWLYPSVAAGSLRTMLGKRVPAGTKVENLPQRLKTVALRGVLPVIGGQLYLPAPADAVVKPVEAGAQGQETEPMRPVVALRPVKPGEDEYLDFPDGAAGLWPTRLPDTESEDFKPDKKPGWWSVGKMAEWLADRNTGGFQVPGLKALKDGRTVDGFWGGPDFDDRMHVCIKPGSGTADDGKLYKTTSLALRDGVCLSARVGHEGSDSELMGIAGKLDDLHPLGGDRKLARWQATGSEGVTGWDCPQGLRDALGKAEAVRMVLATPAVFAGGWKPGWLGDDLMGTPPGAPGGLKVKLVGVSIERWVPVSGFSLENGRLGPKVIRRLVPAGGVYFFEITQGKAADLADCWLRSVCDDGQDRLDGFGLAVWGVWNR